MNPDGSFTLQEATEISKQLLEEIKPFTDRIIVAGYIRLQRSIVRMIELQFISKTETRQKDLFDTYQHYLVDDCVADLVARRILQKRVNLVTEALWNSKYRSGRHVPSGIQVELHGVSEHNWTNQLIKNTGPHEHLLAIKARATRFGLEWKPETSGFYDLKSKEIIAIHSEAQLYELIEYQYLEPWERCGVIGSKQTRKH